jgi:dynamin 1-like protein
MIDMVPKAITLTLVNYAKENMQRELLESLYSKSTYLVQADASLEAQPPLRHCRARCVGRVA